MSIETGVDEPVDALSAFSGWLVHLRSGVGSALLKRMARADTDAFGEFYDLTAARVLGTVLAAGSLLIPMHALGVSTGAQVMVNSGAAEGVYNVAAQTLAALPPVPLPDFDPTAYKQIDVRTVKFRPEAPGEVIIAYKTDKTPEAEQDALIRAIVTLTAADTTPEAVEKSRQDDFNNRVAVWDACVAEGKCQKEASNETPK